MTIANLNMITKLIIDYNRWCGFIKSLMVNIGVPEVEIEDEPLAKSYYKQLMENGILN